MVSDTGPKQLDEILVSSGLVEFALAIKLGKFERSYDVAKRTVIILNNLVKDNSWTTYRELLDTLRKICAYLDNLELVETAASNMARRIMQIIREECHNFRISNNSSSSQIAGGNSFKMDHDSSNATLDASSSASTTRPIDSTTADQADSSLDLDLNSTGVKENIVEAIEQELINELDLSSRSIARQAIDYVQSDEIILTLGKSKIIESFLRHAAEGGKTGRRNFSVVVVELGPFYGGREMAKDLNKSGISTLIVPDSAVFAIMSRVNKVIIGTHSMLANGGIKAPAGSHSVALAAKYFSVPLIVCCPMYKLTPEYLVTHDSQRFRQFSNLHAAYPEPYTPRCFTRPTGVDDDQKEDGPQKKQVDTLADAAPGSVESLHSTFDYVPAELITLFVSNIGGNSPSYVYQLLNELYYKFDYLA